MAKWRWHHMVLVKWVIIGPENVLLPVQHQAIIWTNAKLDPWEQNSAKFLSLIKQIHSGKCIW